MITSLSLHKIIYAVYNESNKCAIQDGQFCAEHKYQSHAEWDNFEDKYRLMQISVITLREKNAITRI